jgi:hypothetical protein
MIFELAHIIVIWILVFLLHEYMHCLEAWSQGADKSRIIIDLKNFSMYSEHVFNNEDIDDNNRGWNSSYGDIYLSGGLYTSLVCFLLVFILGGWMGYYFFMLGWLQLVYGFFEWKYHNRDWFRLGRYCLYALVIAILLNIYWMVK